MPQKRDPEVQHHGRGGQGQHVGEGSVRVPLVDSFRLVVAVYVLQGRTCRIGLWRSSKNLTELVSMQESFLSVHRVDLFSRNSTLWASLYGASCLRRKEWPSVKGFRENNLWIWATFVPFRAALASVMWSGRENGTWGTHFDERIVLAGVFEGENMNFAMVVGASWFRRFGPKKGQHINARLFGCTIKRVRISYVNTLYAS